MPLVQVSEPNEDAVCATLSNGARAALAGYPTSLDQDLAELRAARGAAAGGGSSSSRKEAALLVRVEGVEGGAALCNAPRGSRGYDTPLLVALPTASLRLCHLAPLVPHPSDCLWLVTVENSLRPALSQPFRVLRCLIIGTSKGSVATPPAM